MRKFLLSILCFMALMYIGCQSQSTTDTTPTEAQKDTTEDKKPTWEELIEQAPKVSQEGLDSINVKLNDGGNEGTILKKNIFIYAGSDTAIAFPAIDNHSPYSVEIDTIIYKLPTGHKIWGNAIPPKALIAFWGFFKFDKPLGHLTDTVTIRIKRVKQPIRLILDLNVVEKGK